MTTAYQKILYSRRPVSARHSMAVGHRAKQFAPFAALKGFEDAVREKEIIYEERKELYEEKAYELDLKLRMLKAGMTVRAEYFFAVPEKRGKGRYAAVEGIVMYYNPRTVLRIGSTEIRIPDIIELSGEGFEKLESPC